MTDIDGKVAFITGGASGIGLGLARALVDAGAKVVLASRNTKRLDQALASFEGREQAVLPLVLDVTDRGSLVRAADEAERTLGPVQILCNNAGVFVTAPASDATYEDWDWAMSVNVGGVINCLQTFLPRLKAHGDAHIVTTASMSGLFASGTAGIYTTTKFALVGMMESLRTELASGRVGVSVFCPGLVNTDIHLTELGRPSRYRAPERRGRPLDVARFKKDFLEKGMDPLEAGRCVVAGIRRNDLYILTHPEFERGMRERFEAVLASNPLLSHPVPGARLRAEASTLANPVYRAERERQRAERSGRPPPAK